MRIAIALAAAVVLLLASGHAESSETVKFSSSADSKGEPLMLTGILSKPAGDGPFPAVVLLHGCRGIERSKPRDTAWVTRLVAWGHVALQVDSLGPRGLDNVCSGGHVRQRAQDAYDAKAFLAGLPFVDPHRIAAMGWSHGGTTVLDALIADELYQLTGKEDPFRTAIAFYPFCSLPLRNTKAPLLVLFGELDKATPAGMCIVPEPGTSELEVRFVVYPGAYHGFDWPGINEKYKYSDKQRILYDPAAAEDAVKQVETFLSKYLAH